VTFQIPPTATQPFFQLHGAHPELSRLRVTTFSGHEALSEPFHFVLEMTRRDGEVVASLEDLATGLEGTHIALGIASSGGATSWRHGRVERCAVDLVMGVVTVELVPDLARLRDAARCAVFVGMTTPQIVEKLLTDHGIDQVDTSRLGGTYPVAALRRQHHETSLNFLRRLLEHEGMFFYFEHSKDGHKLVLADGVSGYQDGPSSTIELEHRAQTHDHPLEVVTALVCQRACGPERYVVRAYDPVHPRADLNYSVTGGNDAPASAGIVEHEPGCDEAGVRRAAALRMEEQRSLRHTYSGARGV
jgi:type VI secretion system secreted protein VgrG